MKYLEKLNQSAETTAKENNVLVAEEAKINLQTAILNCKRHLAGATASIIKAEASVPFNPNKLRELSDSEQLMKRDLMFYENLLKELF